MTSAPSFQIQNGDVLAGKYLVDRVLGTGGMGAVVSARHIQLDQMVAIKFLLPDFLDNTEAVARFAREARAAVKIKGDHVARVIDVGTLSNGAPFMVMEHLQGEDLAARLRARGPLPVTEVVDFLIQACEAIAEAHGLGIIHRDLKPSNLFVIRAPDGSEHIKVLDFGISKLTGANASDADMSMTKTSSVMGSPFYMSPEQMESSKSVDAGTDIWALGVILFELLTGQVPFDGDTLPEVCMRIATRAPPPLSSGRPDAPAGLEAVIVRCVEKQREKRYRNVAELTSALAQFGTRDSKIRAERVAKIFQAAGPSESARDLVAIPRQDPQGHARGTMANWEQTTPRSARGRTKIVGAAIAAAVLAFSALGLVLSRGSSPDLRALPAPASGTASTPSAEEVGALPTPEPAQPDLEVETSMATVALPSAPIAANARDVAPPATAPVRGEKPRRSSPHGAAQPAARPSATTASPSRDVFDRGRKW